MIVKYVNQVLNSQEKVPKYVNEQVQMDNILSHRLVLDKTHDDVYL